MDYKAELNYLVRVLDKMHLPVRQLSQTQLTAYREEMCRLLGVRTEQASAIDLHDAKSNTVYRLADNFGCCFICLLLPASPEAQLLLIGPYLTAETTREKLMEVTERLGLPAGWVPRMEEYLAHVAVLRDQLPLLTMVNTFAEVLWGGAGAFEVVELDGTVSELPVLQPAAAMGDEEQNILLRMKLMESRYAYENELMEMVRQGHSHRAELMLAGFSRISLEQRMTDPVRNLKNYSIICNTLMRKAAEQGGVHPIYLDRTSSDFARRIEGLSSVEAGLTMMIEMVRAYCRLVRRQAATRYSPPVQKAVAYIEDDIAGDLSLRALAAAQNISTGYLSTIFSKETGKTLTEYVNERRMETAARLLRTTQLQVQTVAQHCGMLDVNYFSKMFKKYNGVTPKQFREQKQGAIK